jgi:hypothetical protein
MVLVQTMIFLCNLSADWLLWIFLEVSNWQLQMHAFAIANWTPPEISRATNLQTNYKERSLFELKPLTLKTVVERIQSKIQSKSLLRDWCS